MFLSPHHYTIADDLNSIFDTIGITSTTINDTLGGRSLTIDDVDVYTPGYDSNNYDNYFVYMRAIDNKPDNDGLDNQVTNEVTFPSGYVQITTAPEISILKSNITYDEITEQTFIDFEQTINQANVDQCPFKFITFIFKGSNPALPVDLDWDNKFTSRTILYILQTFQRTMTTNKSKKTQHIQSSHLPETVLVCSPMYHTHSLHQVPTQPSTSPAAGIIAITLNTRTLSQMISPRRMCIPLCSHHCLTKIPLEIH